MLSSSVTDFEMLPFTALNMRIKDKMFVFGLTKALPVSFSHFTSIPLSEPNPNHILVLFDFGSTEFSMESFCCYFDLAFNILDQRLF